MSTSAKSVRFDDNSMWVDLSDGRVIAVTISMVSTSSTCHARAAPARGN